MGNSSSNESAENHADIRGALEKNKGFMAYFEDGVRLLGYKGNLEFNEIIKFLKKEETKIKLESIKIKDDIKYIFDKDKELMINIAKVISYYFEKNPDVYNKYILSAMVSGGSDSALPALILGACEPCTRHKLNTVLLIILVLLLIYIVRELYSVEVADESLPDFKNLTLGSLNV
jgi:hypothetical protein